MTIQTRIRSFGDSTPSRRYHGCLEEMLIFTISAWIERTRASIRAWLTNSGTLWARGSGDTKRVGTTISSLCISLAALEAETCGHGRQRPTPALLLKARRSNHDSA